MKNEKQKTNLFKQRMFFSCGKIGFCDNKMKKKIKQNN